MSRRPTPPRPWTPLRFSHVYDNGERIYGNDRYTVTVTEHASGLTQLSIHSHTRGAVGAHDWRHFQRIKSEICGPDREGVEVYPAEDRLVDLANEYHLWVFPEGVRLPFGFDDGRRVTGETNAADDEAALRAYAVERGEDPEAMVDRVRRKSKQRSPR